MVPQVDDSASHQQSQSHRPSSGVQEGQELRGPGACSTAPRGEPGVWASSPQGSSPVPTSRLHTSSQPHLFLHRGPQESADSAMGGSRRPGRRHEGSGHSTLASDALLCIPLGPQDLSAPSTPLSLLDALPTPELSTLSLLSGPHRLAGLVTPHSLGEVAQPKPSRGSRFGSRLLLPGFSDSHSSQP